MVRIENCILPQLQRKKLNKKSVPHLTVWESLSGQEHTIPDRAPFPPPAAGAPSTVIFTEPDPPALPPGVPTPTATGWVITCGVIWAGLCHLSSELRTPTLTLASSRVCLTQVLSAPSCSSGCFPKIPFRQVLIALHVWILSWF